MSDKRNNSGNYNSGDYNSGHHNSGDYNSGHRNSGNCNSGYRNSGNCNSGNYNSGDCNSGHHNSGHHNSGDCNSGHHNSGDCNSGYRNSGDYNSGDCNSGFFCEATPTPMFFDQPSNIDWENVDIPYVELPVCCRWVPSSEMTAEEKVQNPNHETIGGYLASEPKPLTEAFPIAWKKLSEADRQKFLDLPNFDAGKFFRITGVDVRESLTADETEEAKPVQTIILDGVEYLLVPKE